MDEVNSAETVPSILGGSEPELAAAQRIASATDGADRANELEDAAVETLSTREDQPVRSAHDSEVGSEGDDSGSSSSGWTSAPSVKPELFEIPAPTPSVFEWRYQVDNAIAVANKRLDTLERGDPALAPHIGALSTAQRPNAGENSTVVVKLNQHPPLSEAGPKLSSGAGNSLANGAYDEDPPTQERHWPSA